MAKLFWNALLFSWLSIACSEIGLGQTDLDIEAGGVASLATLGTDDAVRFGYAKIGVLSGEIPYSAAVLTLRQNGVVVSEVGVPASPPTTSTRFFVDYGTRVTATGEGPVAVNTGFAVVNLGSGSADIELRLRDAEGILLAQGSIALRKNAHIAKFVDELAPDFVLPANFAKQISFASLELQSDQPISVLALRMTTNQRGDTLMTTAPIADLTVRAGTGSSYYPQLVDGNGSQTTLVLLNTSDSTESGTVQFFDHQGKPLPLGISGNISSSFVYDLPPAGFIRVATDGNSEAVKSGWMRVVPNDGTSAPVGAAIFSLADGNVLTTESAAPSSPPTKRARIYIDKSNGHNTAIAVADAAGSNQTLTINAFESDGRTRVGTTTLELEPNGHVAQFVDELIPAVSSGFTGVLEISSSASFVASSLRSLVNDRGDFLITTIPIADSAQNVRTAPVFPHFCDGEGLQTHFILLSAAAPATTTLTVFDEDGRILNDIVPRVIPAAFFGITSGDTEDWPSFPFGSIGHPPLFAWGWIERAKDSYIWKRFDKYVDAAEARGIDIVITFGATPGWAVSNQETCQFGNGPTRCTAPPDNLEDWKDFVTQIATRYKGRVKFYELWNEGNSRTFWSGTVQDMVQLAKVAYPTIKSIDPNAIVLTPSVTGTVNEAVANGASSWMTRYLRAGGNRYADGGTFHGYVAKSGIRPYPMPEQDTTSGCTERTDCYGSILTRVAKMREVFDENGMAGKPLLNTEGSWGNSNITNPEMQVAWLARWYLLQAGTSVSRAYWYTWGKGSAQGWGTLQTESNGPTAAGIAYGEVYKWLVGATVVAPCSRDFYGNWTCAITRPGGYEALAIWNTRATKSYRPASKLKQYRDLSGRTLSVTGPVTIGAKPILLETGKSESIEPPLPSPRPKAP